MVKYFSKLRTKTKTPLAENISHNNLWGIHESLVLMRGRYVAQSFDFKSISKYRNSSQNLAPKTQYQRFMSDLMIWTEKYLTEAI